jgi:hypothetical protein
MRNATRLFLLLGVLAVPAASSAKKPDPITCPSDVLLAIDAACPCEGRMLPSASVQPWRNHGQYVSCTVRLRNALRKSHCFADDSLRRTFARCAARSTCGKCGAVLCCVPTQETCNDPTPDGIPTGTCANDPAHPCDVAANCAKVRTSRSEAQCLADGGTTAGIGSVCTATCSPSGAFLDPIGF